MVTKSKLIENVRVCLNSNDYKSPSGNYKAHSQNMSGAFSHESGFGMEEWINSSINILTIAELISLGVDVPGDKDIDYRVAFIEAYKIDHYPQSGSKSGKFRGIPRNYLRDVNLFINDAAKSWCQVGEIKNLRALNQIETKSIFNYFLNKGVISRMNSDISSAVKFPFPASIISTATFRPQDVFNCIFPVKDIEIKLSQSNTIFPQRYRWRY